MRCPQCQNEMIRSGNFWVCGNHPQPVFLPVEETTAQELAYSFHPLIHALPFPLALVISEYVREGVPFVKLHRLTDAAELLTRFATMILLSDVLRQRDEFPEVLRKALSEKIERPSFGAWKELLGQACDSLPKRKGGVQCFVADLPAYIKEGLLPALGSGEGERTKEIIALRNLLAHAGRLPDAQAGELLMHHQEPFESLMAELTFLNDYSLITCTADGRMLSLRGLPQPDGSFPAYDLPVETLRNGFDKLNLTPQHATRPLPRRGRGGFTIQPERISLIRETEALDLFPLHAFSEVFQWREEAMERVADAAPQLYFRLNSKGYLEFTTLSERAAFSQQRGVALERFRELFRLEEWRRLTEAQRQQREFAFEDLVTELTEVFVGREANIQQVKERLKAKESGVLFLAGEPGIGKSAVMARLVRDYRNASQHYRVIPYFFRVGHAGCSTDQFLRAALLHLGTALGEPIELSPNPEERRRQFVEAVRAASERLGKKILFLIDGLDEIHRLDPSFPSLLFAASAPKVVWLCAGRHEPALEETLRGGGAEWVFPDGLPKLDEMGTRAMLTAHLERLKYQLFARDEPAEPTYRNRFIDVLVRKSERLPLYVRMVIEDLREGKWTLLDEDKLPAGLTAYFEQILERLRVSDVGTVLTPLFCLLAWAKAPVTEPALKVLLSDHHLSQTAGWEDLFRRALAHGHLMLRNAPTPEGEAGWTFYHDTFRQHLLTTETVSANREWTQAAWLRWCAQWQTVLEESLRIMPCGIMRSTCERRSGGTICLCWHGMKRFGKRKQ